MTDGERIKQIRKHLERVNERLDRQILTAMLLQINVEGTIAIIDQYTFSSKPRKRIKAEEG